MKIKTCSKCHVKKSIEEFYKDNVRIIVWGLNQAFGMWGTEIYEILAKSYFREQGFELTKI